jgi:hypothetical protein
VLDYGLRYEVYTPITERAKRTSSFLNYGDGPGISHQPAAGLQVRVGRRYAAGAARLESVKDSLHLHAGGGITVIPPNIWQDNFLTGSRCRS